MPEVVRIIPAGDSALVLELEARVDPVINARAIQIGDAIRAAASAGVRDVVSSYRSVTVYFDPLRTDADRLAELMASVARRAPDEPPPARPTITVPVCYDEECGPDLQEAAQIAGCSPEEVVRLHSGRTYRVFMLGFVPGFAYMGAVDARIAIPRRPSPRMRVPARSVAIAGFQTGIYPIETPGGWRLIGRTPARPFDLTRADPFLFKPGDRVRFEPVTLAEYRELDAAATGAVGAR